MHLEVDRSDLHHLRAVAGPPADLEPGEARIRVDSFGLTANNITYAVFGDLLRYWECFPGPEEGGVSWGRIPVWGFGDVVESTVGGVTEGTRVFGYFPLADELVVRRRAASTTRASPTCTPTAKRYRPSTAATP